MVLIKSLKDDGNAFNLIVEIDGKDLTIGLPKLKHEATLPSPERLKRMIENIMQDSHRPKHEQKIKFIPEIKNIEFNPETGQYKRLANGS